MLYKNVLSICIAQIPDLASVKTSAVYAILETIQFLVIGSNLEKLQIKPLICPINWCRTFGPRAIMRWKSWRNKWVSLSVIVLWHLPAERVLNIRAPITTVQTMARSLYLVIMVQTLWKSDKNATAGPANCSRVCMSKQTQTASSAIQTDKCSIVTWR